VRVKPNSANRQPPALVWLRARDWYQDDVWRCA